MGRPPRPNAVSEDRSLRVVYTAVASNLAITLSKFVVAFITHSSAMLAEGFHSAADTGNELMLAIGMRRSKRPADTAHPFGYGKEVYVWSLLVGMVVFGLGGGLSIYQGILRLLHPVEPTQPLWSYVVLGAAAVADSYSWWVAYSEINRRRSTGEGLWDWMRRSKDPTVFTVFLEDSADLAGIAIAFLAIFFGEMFHNPYFDAAAPIAIGLLLAAVAAFLMSESRALLVGESANAAQLRRIREIILRDPVVVSVGELLTMQLGPEQVLLNAAIEFQDHLSVQELEQAVERMEKQIHLQEPAVARMFIEPESATNKATREHARTA